MSNASGEIISLASYEPHETNASYGYKTDNTGDWVLFDVCNKITSTPGKANGSITCGDVSIVDTQISESLSMYPNPASSEVTISAKSIITSVRICDINGRTLLEITPKENEVQIDLNAISQGVYIVRIECEDGVFNEKLIKQ